MNAVMDLDQLSNYQLLKKYSSPFSLLHFESHYTESGVSPRPGTDRRRHLQCDSTPQGLLHFRHSRITCIIGSWYTVITQTQEASRIEYKETRGTSRCDRDQLEDFDRPPTDLHSCNTEPMGDCRSCHKARPIFKRTTSGPWSPVAPSRTSSSTNYAFSPQLIFIILTVNSDYLLKQR
jgi:hypothetical protein